MELTRLINVLNVFTVSDSQKGGLSEPLEPPGYGSANCNTIQVIMLLFLNRQ